MLENSSFFEGGGINVLCICIITRKQKNLVENCKVVNFINAYEIQGKG